MQSEDSSSSDQSDDFLYKKKLSNLEIQSLQIPHVNCSETCVIFEKLQCVEWSNKRCLKKVPIYELDLDKAIKLLKNRFNIEEEICIQRKTITKRPFSHQHEKQIKLLQKAALSLKQNNYSIRIISELLGKPKKMIYHLIRYQNLLEDSSFIFQIKQYHLNWIQKFLKSQKYYIELSSMNSIFNQFKREFPFDCRFLRLNQFRRILQKHMKLKFKKPAPFFIPIQLSEQVPEQKQYFLRLLSLKQRYVNIIYVDETIINNKLKQRRYWFMNGQKIKRKSIKLQKNISVLGALGDDRFLCFQLQKGNNNGASFGTFLNRVIEYAIKYYRNYPFAIVLDNSRIHQSKFIRESYLNSITHLFLPRYSPQFNPIELVWQQLKQKLQNCELEDQKQIPIIIHKCLNEIHQEKTQKYINHSLRVGLSLLIK